MKEKVEGENLVEGEVQEHLGKESCTVFLIK